MSGTVALILDASDERYPKGFKLPNFKGKDRLFYPDGVNPETGRFEPVILGDVQYRIAMTMISGRAKVKTIDLHDAIARIGESAARKEPKAPPAPAPKSKSAMLAADNLRNGATVRFQRVTAVMTQEDES